MAGAANAGEVRARLVLDSSNFQRNMQQARNDMEDFKNKGDNIKKGVDKVGEGAAILGGVVVGVVGASVAAAANFQQSMSRLQAMSNANSQQYNDMKEAAIKWGAATKYSATEAADAMTNLSMAGFSVQQSIDALPAVLSMAAAGNLDLGKASEIAGNAMNIFGLQAKDLGHVADVLAVGANTSNADITDLAESLKYAGPVAKGLGLDIETTTAALSLMSNAGIKGSDAGTSLRASLLSLAAPVGQAAKEIKALHLNLKDSHGSLLPLPQLLDNVKKSMEGMTDSQKTSAAAMLVGREAASGFITLVNYGADGLNQFTDSLVHSDGAAQKMAQTMQDNLLGAWENFTGSLENTGITIGTQFLPMLQAIVAKGTDFLNLIGEIDPAMFTTAAAIAGTAAAVAAFGVGLFKAIEAFKALSLLMVTNPWAIAITGVALLAGAVAGYVVQQKEATKVSLDHFNELNKQQQTLEGTIHTYESLQAKNKLTNDEMLRYIDIQKELQATTDPNKIKTLSGAMDLLQQKSGLSKDEINKLVSANDDLIKQAPQTDTAVSGTGNAFATSAKQARELNGQLIEQKRIELDLQKAKMEANVDKNIADYQKQVKQVNADLQERNDKMMNIYRIQAAGEQLDKREAAAQSLKGKAKQDELDTISRMRAINDANLQTAKDQYAAAQDKYVTSRNDLSTLNDTLTKDKEIYAAINQNILASVGLTAQRGQENKAIDDAIAGEQAKRDEIIKQAGGVGNLNKEQAATIKQINDTIDKYRSAGSAIDDNTKKQGQTNGKIDEGKTKAGQLNKELGSDVSKSIKFTGDGMALAKQIDDELGKPVQKTVSIIGKVASAVQQFFQSTDDGSGGYSGTKRHSGGTLPKYHSGGSPVFDQPRADEIDVRLLRNEMVLTEEQQSHLFDMIRNYNTAAVSFLSTSGALGNSAQPTQINVAQLHVREEADVKKVAIELDRLAQQRQRFRG